MPLKIKLKLGGGGSTPSAGSTSSPHPSSPAPTTAVAAAPNVLKGSASPAGPEAVVRTSTPKIRLVKRDEGKGKERATAGAEDDSSAGGSPAPPAKGPTRITLTSSSSSGASTPRIVLKAKPITAASAGGDAQQLEQDASAEPHKSEFMVKPKPIILKPSLLAKQKQQKTASSGVDLAGAPATGGAAPAAAMEMPPPRLPTTVVKIPALARVKAEPVSAPSTPLGNGSSSLPSTPASLTPEDDEDLIIHSPVPSAPAGPRTPALGASTLSGRKLVGGQLQRPFIDALDKMLKELKRRDAYGFFLNPVSDADAPGYSDVIKTPMDLTTITDKAHSGEYDSFDQFEADVRLVFANCLAFNEPESIFGLMATKLSRWTENHLMFYRELILPGTEKDHVRPPPSAAAASIEDADDFSRATSVTAGSPSRSRSVSVAAASADEDGGPGTPAPGSAGGAAVRKRTGNGQLGKKRGPYRKNGQVAVATYFAQPPPPGSAAGAAGGGASGAAAATQGGQTVVQSTQGGYIDEAGRIRGAGAGAYAAEFQNIVRWWEAGGKRAKTKKELSKIATRKARDDWGASVAPDGSRDLREDESLDDVLDAFLLDSCRPPVMDGLPHDFVANSLGRAYDLRAQGEPASLLHSPPAPLKPLPKAVYAEQFNAERLPEAFSWAKPGHAPRQSPTAPTVPLPPPARPHLLAPHDLGLYPLFPSSAISPRGLFEDERRDFLAPPVPPPRKPVHSFSDPLLDTGVALSVEEQQAERREEALRAFGEYDDPLRGVLYGGWVGEAYAGSVENFLQLAYGNEGDRRVADDRAVGAEGRAWVEDNVHSLVFGIEGALPLAKAVGDVIYQAGGLAALDQAESDDEDVVMETNDPSPPLAPPVVKVDPPSPSAAVKREKVDDADTPLPSAPPLPKALDIAPGHLAASLPPAAELRKMIRRMPAERAEKAHLDKLGRLPLCLSSVVADPSDFFADPPPISRSTPTNGKRRRSTTDEKDVDHLPAGGGWPASTLHAVGEELVHLVQEQQKRNEAPRKKTRATRAQDDGQGGFADEESATRARLLLLSLVRRVPLSLLESLTPEQAELLFPEGSIADHFKQLVRS